MDLWTVIGNFNLTCYERPSRLRPLFGVVHAGGRGPQQGDEGSFGRCGCAEAIYRDKIHFTPQTVEQLSKNVHPNHTVQQTLDENGLVRNPVVYILDDFITFGLGTCPNVIFVQSVILYQLTYWCDGFL